MSSPELVYDDEAIETGEVRVSMDVLVEMMKQNKKDTVMNYLKKTSENRKRRNHE